MALASRTDLPNAPDISMPRLHLGLYLTAGEDVHKAVTAALDAGYRAFDTAQDYANESATSAAITAWLSSACNTASLTRADIHYTTKIATNGTYAAARASVKASAATAPGGYVDLFLLHAPYGGPGVRGESWAALGDAVREGEVRAVGVSNFGVGHIEELVASNPRILPAVNQIEVHPFNTRASIRETCAKHNIIVQAYSPLVHGLRMTHPTILELAGKYRCTAGQLLLKWSLQRGMCPLPKSVRKERIIENGELGDVFGKDGMEEEDLRVLDGLDEGLCTDWDPTDCD